jgi:hypothetical protein
MQNRKALLGDEGYFLALFTNQRQICFKQKRFFAKWAHRR